MDSIFSILGYVIAILIAIYFWYRPRPILKRLSWTEVSSSTLISESIKKIESIHVTFQEGEIERLTLVSCKVWNSGAQPILSEDIRSINYTVDKGNILASGIEKITSIENKIDIKVDDNFSTGTLKFDYLNPSDGAEFFLLIDAPKDSKLKLNGSIIGGKIYEPIRIDPKEDRPGIKHIIWSFIMIFGLCVLWSLLFVINDPVVFDALTEIYSSNHVYHIFGLGFIAWIFISYIFLKIRSERASEPIESKMISVVNNNEN